MTRYTTRKYQASQSVLISGLSCGTEIELEMIVDYAVTPEEPMTRDHPGAPRMVEDIEVRFMDGKDELNLPWSIGDRFGDSDGFKRWLLSEAADRDEADYIDAAEMKAEARREREWEDRL